MKLKFTQTQQLETIGSFDEETEEMDSDFEIISENQEIEADIIGQNDGMADLQLPDGRCIYSVPTSTFTVIEE